MDPQENVQISEKDEQEGEANSHFPSVLAPRDQHAGHWIDASMEITGAQVDGDKGQTSTANHGTESHQIELNQPLALFRWLPITIQDDLQLVQQGEG